MKNAVFAASALCALSCAACSPAPVTAPPDAPPSVEQPAPTTAYVNERLGISMDLPDAMTVTGCSRHETEGKRYVMPDTPLRVPLRHTEMNGALVLYPERYEEAFGEVETSDSRYYADCRMTTVTGALLNRKTYHDYTLWTLHAETVRSESGIPASVVRNCTREAKFTGLEPSSQSGVLTVGIDVDMTKTEDSSSVFCPDLAYAKYVPSTRRLYYLFISGPRYEDPAIERMPDSLRFVTDSRL